MELNYLDQIRGRRMPKKVGSRFRSVPQKRNQGRFPVTLGHTKNVTKVGSRLRSVTHRRNKGRFPVTLDYTKT